MDVFDIATALNQSFSKVHSSSQPQDSAANPTRACVTCRKLVVSPWSKYVNCSRCRELKRTKKIQALERKRDRNALHLNVFSNVTEERTIVAPHMPGLKENKHIGKVHAQADPVKRRRSKALHEIEADDHNAAMSRMKKRIDVITKAKKGVDSKPLEHIHGTSHSSPGGKEYQTATALYDSLKRRSANSTIMLKKLKFNGYHAIVAVSTIDHQKRLEMVANDLRKIARLPFDHTKPNGSYDFKTMARTVTFQCTCLGHKSISTDAQLMGTTPQVSVPKICGGTVTIKAIDDDSHPLKILGQRIIVRIEHI